MSDIQEIILQTAEKLFSKYAEKSAVDKAENGIFAQELWTSLQESGLLLIGIPEQMGGNGGDLADGFSLLQLAGKYSAPVPLAETLLCNWILAELRLGGTNEVLTLSCLNSREQLDYQAEVLSGQVFYAPYGRHADRVLAVTSTAEGPSIIMLPVKMAKVTAGSNLAGEARDCLDFIQMPVSDSDLHPISNDVYEKINYLGALMRVTMMAGAIERVMELVIEHVESRRQFGKPLFRQQAIQQHLAILAGELAAAKTAASNAIASYEKGTFKKDIPLAKIRLNEAAGVVSKIAHQIVAAMGFTHEHSLHHSTRRLWSYREEFGTEREWSQVIVEQLQSLKDDGLWGYLTEKQVLKGEENERSIIQH